MNNRFALIQTAAVAVAFAGLIVAAPARASERPPGDRSTQDLAADVRGSRSPAIPHRRATLRDGRSAQIAPVRLAAQGWRSPPFILLIGIAY